MFRNVLCSLVVVITLFSITPDTFAESVGSDSSGMFNRKTPVVLAYQKVADAIVNISGSKKVRSSMRGFDLPDFFGDDFFGNSRYKTQKFELGSGFVVHEGGYVVTNAHVVDGTSDIQVRFSDGLEYKANVVSVDENRDLAFLKIDSENEFHFVPLGISSDLMIGEPVIAVGNPFGYSNSVTEGIVSATGRDIQLEKSFWLRGLIQTSAPINPGNSGGPLLNINGELIGINTAIRASAQNIGFAIPVDTLADNLIHMLMPEEMRRVRLGLLVGRFKDVNGASGLIVESVADDSPAYEQGIRKGDLLISMDKEKFTGFIDFYVKLMGKQVGDSIEFEYARGKDDSVIQKTAKLMLEERLLPDGGELAGRFFQFEVSELGKDLAEKFGFDDAYEVLIITGVDEGVARDAGLKSGDIILDINGSSVSNMNEFSVSVENIKAGDIIKMQILRIANQGGYQVQRRYVVQLKAGEAKKGERYQTL